MLSNNQSKINRVNYTFIVINTAGLLNGLTVWPAPVWAWTWVPGQSAGRMRQRRACGRDSLVEACPADTGPVCSAVTVTPRGAAAGRVGGTEAEEVNQKQPELHII